MSGDKRQYLVETDILVDHLTTRQREKSLLENLMESGICFTTVINSAEIYFAVENNVEKQAVDALMKGMKVLGFNSRYSLYVDKFNTKVRSVRDALICATAEINKLNIVTTDTEKYSDSGLTILQPDNM